MTTSETSGSLAIRSWERVPRICVSPLRFQVVTFEQETCCSPLQPLTFLMYERYQFFSDRFQFTHRCVKCSATEVAKAVIESALRNTHHETFLGNFTEANVNVGYPTDCIQSTS